MAGWLVEHAARQGARPALRDAERTLSLRRARGALRARGGRARGARRRARRARGAAARQPQRRRSKPSSRPRASARSRCRSTRGWPRPSSPSSSTIAGRACCSTRRALAVRSRTPPARRAHARAAPLRSAAPRCVRGRARGRAAGPRADARLARGSDDPDVHVGHDRRAEGRAAPAPQDALQLQERRRLLRARARRPRARRGAAVPFLRPLDPRRCRRSGPAARSCSSRASTRARSGGPSARERITLPRRRAHHVPRAARGLRPRAAGRLVACASCSRRAPRSRWT